MAVGLVKRPLTVEQFNRMIDSRIIPENDRVELIEGDIVEMAPIGTRHASYVARVADVFREFPAEFLLILVQSPIRLSPVTRVEPDVALVRRRADFYVSRLPGPEDILLVVEVGDTSLESDRAVKIPQYARAGIPDAWLVDVTTDHVEVYRTPTPEGYQELHRVAPGEVLSLHGFPGLVFPASRIVGPLA